ncbi:MAG: hypothetical protein IT462_09390 [Planctomycetes bacterium]|nr:hypothetical protein [Planctomycetota bacterium]
MGDTKSVREAVQKLVNVESVDEGDFKGGVGMRSMADGSVVKHCCNTLTFVVNYKEGTAPDVEKVKKARFGEMHFVSMEKIKPEAEQPKEPPKKDGK